MRVKKPLTRRSSHLGVLRLRKTVRQRFSDTAGRARNQRNGARTGARHGQFSWVSVLTR